MRLVYDLRYATDHFPGIGTFAWGLANGMLDGAAARAGFDDLVFLWDPRAGNSRFDVSGLRADPRSRWHELPESALGLSTAWGTGRCLERMAADVFLSPFWIRPQRSRVRCVLTLHDVIPLAMPRGTSVLRRWAYRWELRRAARADAVLTVSRSSREEIIRWTSIPASRVHVVTEGVPPPSGTMSRPARVPEGAFALVVGANRAHKGHDTLAAAWRTLGTAPPLALVAAGPIAPTRFSLATAARATPGIHAIGPVSPPELEWLYTHATLVLVPSRYEGFGLPLLEAAAHGTPVIASDIPALRETGDGVARFVPAGDTDAWAAAVRELAVDAQARVRMRAAGLERAARYTDAECARRVLDVVRAVAGRQR